MTDRAPAPVRFTIDSDETGVAHGLDVFVHADQPALVTHLEQVLPDEDWRQTNRSGRADLVAGVFISAGGFTSTEAPWLLGEIHLCRGWLSIATVVHEVTHAASFIYSVDVLRPHSRALVHLHVENETIAYLVGDLSDALFERIEALGCFDPD